MKNQHMFCLVMASLAIAATSCKAIPIAMPQHRILIGDDQSPKGVVSYSTPAELRLAFLRNKDAASLIYCAEPMPDVALGSSASASSQVNASVALAQSLSTATSAALIRENQALRQQLAASGASNESSSDSKNSNSTSATNSLTNSTSAALDVQGAIQLAISVSELGGRSQQVLLAREFLYRICEARANGFYGKDGADEAFITLHREALDMIKIISTPPKASAVADRATLVQRINEYNSLQLKRCDSAKEDCITVDATDKDKKAKCSEKHQTCLGAIEMLTPSDPDSQKK